MRTYGLIGKQLSYSFSKQYFQDKFEREEIKNSAYDLYELDTISEFPKLIKTLGDHTVGLNVTIPYKKEVIPFLDRLDPIAEKIGAVNVIKMEGNKLIGFNSDYFGFRTSLERWLKSENVSALILGTGGASEAVSTVLSDLEIEHTFVSRKSQSNALPYDQLNEEKINENLLIINTTPLGTYPKIEDKPDIPYQFLSKAHYLYDLTYNPPESAFLKEGKLRGADIKNGLEMLELQAEESWRIWNGTKPS